ncbi:hypothetical protein [Povalibacter sp.]|uniref:hypothetical protein n=1 Tax=Povalibacter sp. TaxID=1962978 RepID=UPI002F42A99D
MNRRLTALLLVWMLGMQSLTPPPAFAQAPANAVAHHCDGMADAAMPHGQNSADNELSCSSHCAMASVVLVTAIAPTITIDGSSGYAVPTAVPLQSRFDIPPTPPPIA